MTFEEAKKFKESIGKEFHNGDFPTPYKIFVVPKDDSDFKRYLLYYRRFFRPRITDEISKLYSSNNEFAVVGIAKHQSMFVHKTFDPKDRQH